MWTNSLSGTSSKSSGSRSFLAFLLVFFSLSAYSLSAQTTEPTQPQTTPSKPLSEMTQSELIKLINSKDALLKEWLTQYQKWTADRLNLETRFKALETQYNDSILTANQLKISLAEQKKASEEQLAARDKQLQDQSYALVATEKERDAYKDELQRRKGWDAVEKALIGLGGFGLGYTTGALIH